MKILVLNCGSSSVKFQLLEMDNEKLICKGIVEKIGSSQATLRFQPRRRPEIKEVLEVLDHQAAINLVVSTLMHPKDGVIKDKSEIDGIGHRTVHGGEDFSQSVLIDERVIESIRICSDFAPLHNPHNLKGIEVCSKILPGIKQVAVFDTAFHQTMRPVSYMYGLPFALYRKLKVRRYGFHGTSHRFVAQRASEILNRPLEELKVITCHLGNGASIAAILGGSSVDTTMGFTPLEGLLMGTRCGDLDPALVLYVMEKEEISSDEMNNLMNKRSGLLGISETSNDLREVMEEAKGGSYQHQLAIDIFCHRVKRYIGAYAAEMGGLDAVVFTGGIGENSAEVREQVCRELQFLGIDIDKKRNKKNDERISSGETAILVIPTNEELAIARDTRDILLAEEKKGEIMEETIAQELASLSKEERAELLLTWAENPHVDMSTLSWKFGQRIGKIVTSQALQRELTRLGLLEGQLKGREDA